MIGEMKLRRMVRIGAQKRTARGDSMWSEGEPLVKARWGAVRRFLFKTNERYTLYFSVNKIKN